MALRMFSMPFGTLAQQKSVLAGARSIAIADAESDVNKTSWFMIGFFLNIVGVVIAKENTPAVPAGRLVGKSPEYVETYTLSYQAKLTQLRVQSTLQGCVTGTLVGLCCYSSTSGSSSSSGGISSISLGEGSGWCNPLW